MKTKAVNVGGLTIGCGSPVVVQSMTNTDTRDAAATVEQILRLEEAGCELVRVAVPDMEAAGALPEIKKRIHIPLAADIHFDYRLALASLKAGVDKLRLNPGNIGEADRVRQVVEAAKQRNVPIRIGVNSGSLERAVREKHGGVTPEALVESAMGHVAILEDMDYDEIILSIKSSDVRLTYDAYIILSERCNYPLHIGVTEAGTPWAGSIKSAVCTGALLMRGIGDTIRVSLTGDPVEEVRTAREILKSAGLRSFGPVLISCPTCGRTETNMIAIARIVEEKIRYIDKPLKIAVMGCAVNGPGEACDADYGIACGRGSGLIFARGQIIKKAPEESLADELINTIMTHE